MYSWKKILYNYSTCLMFTWGKLICIEFLYFIKKKSIFAPPSWDYQTWDRTAIFFFYVSLAFSLSLSLSLCVLTDAVSAFLLLESSSSSPILCRWWTARTARLPYLLLLSTTAQTARLPYFLLLWTSLLSLSTTHACSQALLKFDVDLFFYLNHFLMGQL